MYFQHNIWKALINLISSFDQIYIKLHKNVLQDLKLAYLYCIDLQQ